MSRIEELRLILKEYDSKTSAYKGLVNIEVLEGILEEYDRLDKNYDRIYNENCKLREEHNINDISLLDENYRLNNIINELEKYINETKLEEFEKSYGRRYAKTFTQAEVIICNMILNKLQELKGDESNGR